MKWLYLFDESGNCFQKRTVESDTDIAWALEHTESHQHCASGKDVSVNRAKLVNGELADVEPTVTAAVQWVIVRNRRDSLLTACDWTQLPDAPASKRKAWATYRQALRDITLQTDPFNITWPVAPA